MMALPGPTEYVRRCLNRLSAASFSYYACWPIYKHGWFSRVQQIVYPVAFAGFLISFVVRCPVKPAFLAASQSFYVFTLLPYVLVSFYHRYAVALFPIRIFLALSLFLAFWWYCRKSVKSAFQQIIGKSPMDRRVLVAIAGLLTFQVTMLARTAFLLTPVYDEPGHFVAGLSHWQYLSSELYRVNPPMPRMVMTAIPYLLGARIQIQHPKYPDAVTRGDSFGVPLF